MGGNVDSGCSVEGGEVLIMKHTQIKNITKITTKDTEEKMTQRRKSRKMSSLLIASASCLTAINMRMKPTRGKINSNIAPIPPTVFRFLASKSFISSIFLSSFV